MSDKLKKLSSISLIIGFISLVVNVILFFTMPYGAIGITGFLFDTSYMITDILIMVCPIVSIISLIISSAIK